jgi:DNA-binding phage protein
MARRAKELDKELSKKLKSRHFASQFFLNLIENKKMPLKSALREAIHPYGLKELAEVSGLVKPNITRALDEESHPQIARIENLPSPFSVKLSARSLR